MNMTILPYQQNQEEFIQEIGDKSYESSCVVYIDGSLWCHEYTNVK